MATVSAHARIMIEATSTPAANAGKSGPRLSLLENATGGTYWTSGNASGQADTIYNPGLKTLAAAATDSYNTLAAGALTDIEGATVDLDELKCIVVRCVSGAIKIDAPAANYMGFFGTATDYVPLGAGQTWAMDFGPGGLNVTVNSKFDIVDTNGGSGSTYYIEMVGAS
jgi:hypothetical protein